MPQMLATYDFFGCTNSLPKNVGSRTLSESAKRRNSTIVQLLNLVGNLRNQLICVLERTTRSKEIPSVENQLATLLLALSIKKVIFVAT